MNKTDVVIVVLQFLVPLITSLIIPSTQGEIITIGNGFTIEYMYIPDQF